jgi:ketol-acid reductoisomerase
MSTIYHDDDADLGALAGETIAVVGYGNQGRAQALNLRDSGLRVVIGNIRDAALEQAQQDGFEVLPIADACADADAVMLLVPDEIMPLYAEQVAPTWRRALLGFASGYNVAFACSSPPPISTSCWSRRA